jgi:hypothetical protein
MNIEKIEKYTYKYINNPKEIYINKLNFYGGQIYDGIKFNSIMGYITNKVSPVIKNNPNNFDDPKMKKHLIMLYGPPASGKSKAKDIILHRLNIKSDEYVDINLDEIIADDISYIKGIKKLKAKGKLTEEIKKEASLLYFSIRRKANIIFELLLFITRTYNISLTVEVTGGSYCAMIWWYNILNFYKSKDYTISLIYPVVSNSQDIIERALYRGNQNYRFVSGPDIKNSIINAKKNIKTILETRHDLFDNIIIYYNDDRNLLDTNVNTQEFNNIFNDNIIYLKEDGKEIQVKDNSFISEIKNSITAVFLDNKNKHLTPEKCVLTF